MAQWAKIRALRLYDTVTSLYGENFPLEIRGVLATWLEQHVFNTGIDPDNPQHASYVQNFFGGLLEQLQSEIQKIDESDDRGLFFRKSLIEAHNRIRVKYFADASSLFRTLQYCLQHEQQAILQAERQCERTPSASPIPPPANKDIHFRSQFDDLNNMKHLTLACIQNMKTAMEQSANESTELHRFNGLIMQAPCHPNGSSILNELNLRKTQMENNISQYKSYFVYNYTSAEEQMQNILSRCILIQTDVIGEIASWQDEQRLKANGLAINPITKTLDMLQDWCSELATMHMSILQQLKEIERLKQTMTITDGLHLSLKESFHSLIKQIVVKSFIVEVQPPQVIQTKTKIGSGVTIRLLVGATLNQYLTPDVTATLVGESQAYALSHQDQTERLYQVVQLAPLTNSKTNMKFDGKKRFAAEFMNIKMPDKIPRRGNRTPLEVVAEEKACFHFASIFSVGELNIPIWTLSLPIGITVHKSQEPQAWGAITWDNSFAQPGRLPFQVSNKERWEAVENMLDIKFASKTGRSLTADNKQFLKQKIFQNASHDGYVTWPMFYKDELPGTLTKSKDSKEPKGFTFWQWFYSIMELIEAKCKDLWQAGKIEGFISKDSAERKLLSRPDGTFLMRFSDSKLGGITIAWKHSDKKVYSVQPYVATELETKSLQDRVHDLSQLQFLYPDIPKEIAFEVVVPETLPRAENPPTIKKGYVTPKLVETVPAVTSPLNGFKLLSTMTPPHQSPSPAPFQPGNMPYSPAMSDTQSYGSPYSACSSDSYAFSDDSVIKELEEMLDKTNYNFDSQ